MKEDCGSGTLSTVPPRGFLRRLTFCLLAAAFTIAPPASIAYASQLKYQPVEVISTSTTTPNQFAVGDFNGDGKPDFAFADQNGTTLSAYMNQGGGKFSAPVVTQIGSTFLGAILAGEPA